MPFPIAMMCVATLIGMLCATGIGMVAGKLGFPIPDEKRRAGTIDGLRGYLALAVMAQHFSIWALRTRGGDWQEAPGTILQNFGVTGVMLFFMITGFLFLPKVLGGWTETRWRSLYVSRIFRILPLQFVVVLLVSIIALAHQDFAPGDTWKSYPLRAALWMTSWGQPALFGYKESALVNAAVLWSLRYEWTFYLGVLPVLALALSLRSVRKRPMIIPAVLIVIGTAAHWLHPMPTFFDSLGAFGLGMMARLILSRDACTWARKPAVAIVTVLVLAAILATIHNPLALYVLIPLGFFFFIVAAGNRLGGVVANRGAYVLGECSFGIYMLHGIVLHVGFTVARPMLSTWPLEWIVWLYPLAALVVTLVSFAAFLYIEAPAVALGRRVAARLRPPPPPSPPVVAVPAADGVG